MAKAKRQTKTAQTNGQRATRPATHQEDPLLLVKEAAKQLGMSERTIYNLIKDGKIEAGRHQNGSMRVWRIRQSQINRVLACFPSHQPEIAEEPGHA